MPALVFLYTETPLHAGAGTRVSYVDLPIQRERITHYPMIQSSSLKGVLRWEAFQAAKSNQKTWDFKKVATIFGPGDDLKRLKRYDAEDPEVESLDVADFGGTLAFTDARLLLFPVRSLYGVFAWITCPMVLKRLLRDIYTLKFQNNILRSMEELTKKTLKDSEILVGKDSSLVVKLNNQENVVLEDFQLKAERDSTYLEHFATYLKQALGSQNPFIDDIPRKVALVSDNVFQEFTEMTTEIISRIRIDQLTGTVAQGALWTEELVPSETLFWTLIKIDKPYHQKAEKWGLTNHEDLEAALFKLTHNQVLQFGGDETLGRGWLRLHWWKPNQA